METTIRRRGALALLGAAGAGLLASPSAGAAPSSGSTLIRGASIFDGRRSRGPGDVLISDGRIRYVGQPLPREVRCRVVDGRGQMLLPGFIDAHAHPRRIKDLATAAAYGVTTELDMFCFPRSLTAELRVAAATRDDVADLRSVGILASAQGGFPGAMLPDLPTLAAPADADAFVAARQAEGSDYIKIFVEDSAVSHRPALSPDTVAAVVAAAHRRGLSTVAHATSGWATETALAAGARAITHLPLDITIDAGTARRFAAGGQICIPTMAIQKAGERPQVRDSVAALYRARVPLLVGTDANDGGPGVPAAVPHGAGLHDELALLVRSGLPPTAALAAATAEPAQRLGLTDRGRVAPGLRPDLVLVAGDPTVDITATRRITHIWRRGVSIRP